MIPLAAFARVEKARARAIELQANRDGLRCAVLHDPWKEPHAFLVFCWPVGAPMNKPVGCTLVYDGAAERQLAFEWGAGA